MTNAFQVGDRVRIAAWPHPILGPVAYGKYNGTVVTITETMTRPGGSLPLLGVNQSGLAYAVEFEDGTDMRYVDHEHLVSA